MYKSNLPPLFSQCPQSASINPHSGRVLLCRFPDRGNNTLLNTEAFKLIEHNTTHTTSGTLYPHWLKTITELERLIMICQYIFAIQLFSQVHKHFSSQTQATCQKYKELSHWPLFTYPLAHFLLLLFTSFCWILWMVPYTRHQTLQNTYTGNKYDIISHDTNYYLICLN
jgi:hypothetical protein